MDRFWQKFPPKSRYGVQTRLRALLEPATTILSQQKAGPWKNERNKKHFMTGSSLRLAPVIKNVSWKYISAIKLQTVACRDLVLGGKSNGLETNIREVKHDVYGKRQK